MGNSLSHLDNLLEMYVDAQFDQKCPLHGYTRLLAKSTCNPFMFN